MFVGKLCLPQCRVTSTSPKALCPWTMVVEFFCFYNIVLCNFILLKNYYFLFSFHSDDSKIKQFLFCSFWESVKN